MLRKIKLYGKLAKFVGHRVLEAEVKNAAEAVRFLIANWPELEKHMADQYYKVSAGDWEISKEELHYPTGASDISITPVIGGAGKGTGKILLGVALIAGAILLGPSTFAFMGIQGTTASSIGIVAANVMASTGASLVLYGVAEALTPIPTVPEETQDPINSFSFGGIQNTSRAGVPVPVVYGKMLTGSIVVSAAIDTNQVEV
tara:strand:- start:7758 stop:8363 length:606 start_codon:yes stop_codon:yes gene_type:complete